MTTKHPADSGGEGRGFFEKVSERASNVLSSPLFFAICIAMVVAFALSYLLDWSDDMRFFLGDLLGAVTLAIVALLKTPSAAPRPPCSSSSMRSRRLSWSCTAGPTRVP